MSANRKHPTQLVTRHIALPLEAGLIVAGLFAIVMRSPTSAFWLLVIWLVAGITYTAFAIHTLFRASRDAEVNRIEMHPGHKLTGVWSNAIHIDVGIISIASVMGVLGASTVLRHADESDFAGISRMVAALSIVSAWLLLQFGFSRLYADSYYRQGASSGLEFPGTPDPGLIEFAYFTLSIGATFQTSDTSVTSTHMRWLVTIHAGLCFVYNTVFLALAITLLLGI